MKKKSLSLEEEANVCYLYVENNTSAPKIADIYNCDPMTIYRCLKRNNIQSRKTTRSLFNHSYFKKIDTPEKAYFLGLIMADGCNMKTGLNLGLQEEDAKIIYLFKQSIESTGNIRLINRNHIPNNKNQVLFNIYSKELSDDLTSIGVPPNKSLVLKYPNIDTALDSHFIRGYFDGDGCITHVKEEKYLRFGLTGTKELINSIQNKLIENCELNKTVLNKRKNNIVDLSYGGNKQIKRIYNYLYKDCSNFYICRKKEKFESILTK